MEKKQTNQNKRALIVLSILLVIVVLASACYFTLGGAEKKKDKAVQNIEAALAQDNFKKARKTLSEIPSSFIFIVVSPFGFEMNDCFPVLMQQKKTVVSATLVTFTTVLLCRPLWFRTKDALKFLRLGSPGKYI